MQDAESKDIVSCLNFVVKRNTENLGSTEASHYVHVDLMSGENSCLLFFPSMGAMMKPQ